MEEAAAAAEAALLECTLLADHVPESMTGEAVEPDGDWIIRGCATLALQRWKWLLRERQELSWPLAAARL